MHRYPELTETAHAAHKIKAAKALKVNPADITIGVKITHTDGTTHNGYQWPLPTNGKPAVVATTAWDPNNGGSCPRAEGDGLCVGLSIRPLTSGGVPLASCIGLVIGYVTSEARGYEADKKRVPRCVVLGLFAPLRVLREGLITDLCRAYMYGADLSGANLSGANLTGAYMYGADLCRAHMYGADLTGADLYGAYMYGANLSEANLSGANLSGADLTGANLTGANLRGANLRGANLSGANLSGANHDTATLWPAGFAPPA